MMAPIAAPTSGATQNSQSCPKAPVSANRAAAAERAGLTDVLLIGIEIRWIRVRERPMAIGAKPDGTADEVEPRMTMRKNAVSTISAINAAVRLKPPGDNSP
ncbi:hypothetical protein D9M69_597200 [compost metagenome]